MDEDIQQQHLQQVVCCMTGSEPHESRPGWPNPEGEARAHHEIAQETDEIPYTE